MSVSLDPQDHEAVIFDLDGVSADTASVHRAAWTRRFDDHPAERPDTDADAAQELGERKHGYFLDHLERDGVVVFGSTVELVCPLQLRGVRTAVFSAGPVVGVDRGGAVDALRTRGADVVVGDPAEVHVEVEDDEELGRRLSRLLERGGATDRRVLGANP